MPNGLNLDDGRLGIRRSQESRWGPFGSDSETAWTIHSALTSLSRIGKETKN